MVDSHASDIEIAGNDELGVEAGRKARSIEWSDGEMVVFALVDLKISS